MSDSVEYEGSICLHLKKKKVARGVKRAVQKIQFAFFPAVWLMWGEKQAWRCNEIQEGEKLKFAKTVAVN